MQVRYTVSTGKIEVIKSGTTVASFLPSELSTDSTTGLALYTRGTTQVGNLPSEVFELHDPQISGVPLTYVRFGTYVKLNVGLLSQTINPIIAFVFGQPTDTGSMPHSGTATYSSDVYGAVAQLNGLNTQLYTVGNGNGSATFSANFADMSIATAINLVGKNANDNSITNFGTLSGSGSITSGGPAFSGTLGGAASGGFTGAFFGPGAVEMGYVFQAKGSNFITYGNVFGTTAPPPP